MRYILLTILFSVSLFAEEKINIKEIDYCSFLKIFDEIIKIKDTNKCYGLFSTMSTYGGIKNLNYLDCSEISKCKSKEEQKQKNRYPKSIL